MSAKIPSFCIVGSGIIGLSSAFCLAKRFRGCTITVLSDKSSPYTTSDHSFGICSLSGVQETDSNEIIRWTKQTIGYIGDTIQQKSADLVFEMGIWPIKAYLAYYKHHIEKDEKNFLVRDTFSFHRELRRDEIESLGYREQDLGLVFKKDFVGMDDLVVYETGTWIIDTHSYLPWLKKELESMEAREEIRQIRFVKKRINDFSEACDEDYDCIVNCSGLGSEFLVPDDKMVPIRGQYLIAEQTKDSELRYAHGSFVCSIPGRVTLGSVYQKGRWDTEVDPRDSKDIMQRCCVLNPSIASLKIIKEDVGIRPGRYGGARVELEMRRMKSLDRLVPVIHNYGHGSKGVMQHWGCALDVVKLAENAIARGSKL